MSWTHFMDMHSGGGRKLDWEHIYIEAPADEARVVFYNRFDRSPDRVTCTCCGEDYSVTEYETLEEATAYYRGDSPFARGPKVDIETYLRTGGNEGIFNDGPPMVIRADEITADDRRGSVPAEGYVWMGG